jgi:triosephosphate isomerase (TIM)
MLADSGIKWTLTGHSERRVGFGFPGSLFTQTNVIMCIFLSCDFINRIVGETSKVVGIKTKNAIDCGISVMACIGEQLADREKGKTMDVCSEQLQGSFIF